MLTEGVPDLGMTTFTSTLPSSATPVMRTVGAFGAGVRRLFCPLRLSLGSNYPSSPVQLRSTCSASGTMIVRLPRTALQRS